MSKGTSDLESFKPVAEYYRKKFIEAGYDYTLSLSCSAG
jgi:hypothetical protein